MLQTYIFIWISSLSCSISRNFWPFSVGPEKKKQLFEIHQAWRVNGFFVVISLSCWPSETMLSHNKLRWGFIWWYNVFFTVPLPNLFSFTRFTLRLRAALLELNWNTKTNQQKQSYDSYVYWWETEQLTYFCLSLSETVKLWIS